jgi:hypothetical protein
MDEANRKYILTQGPLPNTTSHFWLMVWEQNCKAVLMLNKIVEKNQVCSNIFSTFGEFLYGRFFYRTSPWNCETKAQEYIPN